MENVLITGGAGFIGSHLVDHLIAQNYRVCIVDDFSSGCIDNIPSSPNLEIVRQDASQLKPSDLPYIDWHTVVHLAALPSVVESWNISLAAHDRTLTSTLNMLEVSRKLGVRQFILASSAAVYGNPQNIPITEDQELNPLSPYGLQKKMAEEYLKLWSKEYAINCIALRFFNVFGLRQKANSPYSGVISKFIQCLKTDQDIVIFGDGQQTRDFIHVLDVVHIISDFLALEQTSPRFDIFNVASGVETTIENLLTLLRHHKPNWKGRIVYANERPADIKKSLADIKKISLKLNCRPKLDLLKSLGQML